MNDAQYHCRVVSVGTYLPDRVVTNDELAQMMTTSDAWIRERSGIETRHYAASDQSTADLGVAASRVALERAGWTASDLDLIIAATLSPDYYFPGIGVQIEHALGGHHQGAIDIRGQCSGFSWALSTADAYLRSGIAKRILVVGAERHSRVLEFSDRGRDVTVLFGDGAGALTLEAATGPACGQSRRGFLGHILGSDGGGVTDLLIERPGNRYDRRFFDPEDDARGRMIPAMNGRQVFKHAVSRMSEIASELLDQHRLRPDDIDLFVPHQANLRIIEAVGQRVGFAPEQIVTNIQKVGNTTAATLPLALADAEAAGRLKPGSRVLTATFGAGFTWGANLFHW